MSFLLGECKELNYTELVEINGGGAMGFLGKISITGNNNQGARAGVGAGSTIGTPTSGTAVPAATSTSSGCSGSCGGTTSSTGGSQISSSKKEEQKLVTNAITTTNNCKGAYISYYSQLSFTDAKMSGGTKFGKTACGATSIANEISEQYTRETGKTLSEAQLLSAMKKAVDAGMIDGTDAFVNDWGGAAQVMSESLGLKGKWSYTTNAKEATAIIISIDTNGDGNKDGYHDHFVNDIGNGQYYDPYTNKIGYIKDLTLTSKWASDAGIKSAYRYIQYTK